MNLLSKIISYFVPRGELLDIESRRVNNFRVFLRVIILFFFLVFVIRSIQSIHMMGYISWRYVWMTTTTIVSSAVFLVLTRRWPRQWMVEFIIIVLFVIGLALLYKRGSPMSLYAGILPVFILACPIFLYPRRILMVSGFTMSAYSFMIIGQMKGWLPVPLPYPPGEAFPLSLFIVNFLMAFSALMGYSISSELLTRRRLIERILSRYRMLMDAAPDPIIVWDRKGRITMVNPVACKMLGYEKESDLIGKTGADIIHPDKLEDANRSFREDIRTRKSRILEFEFVKRNGEKWPIELHITPIREANQVVGLLGICRDISERLRTEQERDAFQKKIVLQDKMASLGRLVLGIAHEYNNVFAGLRGYAQLAQMPGKENRLRELPKITMDLVDRAQIVTEGLLVFSERFNPDSDHIRPMELVEGITRIMRKDFERRGIKVELDIPKDAEITTDVPKLQHAMLNLIANACDAMSKGGTLRIRYFSNIAKDIFEVEDDGGGMPNEILPHIFEPFFTTKGVLASGGDQWLGLGLSACYSIVQGLGGEIVVESEEGVGTKFKVELPRVSSQNG